MATKEDKTLKETYLLKVDDKGKVQVTSALKPQKNKSFQLILLGLAALAIGGAGIIIYGTKKRKGKNERENETPYPNFLDDWYGLATTQYPGRYRNR